jgi:methylamine utilization protein MauE
VALVVLACRWCLVAVFLVAAVAKFRALARFRASLRSLRLVPRRLVPAVAAGVVVTEVVVAVLLAVPVSAWWGLVAAVALCAGLAAVPASALLRGQTVTCACFGSSRLPLGWWQLGRNVALLTVAALGVAGAAFAGPEIDPAGLPIALAAAAFVATLAVLTDHVAALFVRAPH